MTSEKQIILLVIALSLTVSSIGGAHVGKSSAVKCRSSKDCPSCDSGETYCVVGQCSCIRAVADVAQVNKKCKNDDDCAGWINSACHPACRIFFSAAHICTCACS